MTQATGGAGAESKLKDLRLTGNPRDPRLSSSDARVAGGARHETRFEAQAAAWDPVASAKPPSAGGGGAVPLVSRLHGPGFKSSRPSPASASGKPSPVTGAKPSSGSTKSPAGGSSGYTSSGKPSPVSSAGGPPSPFTRPVTSPAQAKPQGSPGSRRRPSHGAGKPVVLQSHLHDAVAEDLSAALSERVGGELSNGGCVVWEGQLVGKKAHLCSVNMVAFGTSVKPARM